MIKKKTKNKKGEYTNQKNEEKPVKVVEKIEEIPGEQLFPQTRMIAPVKEFDKPLVKLEEAVAAWEQYQDLINALIKTQDIVVIQGVKKAKRSGINKIARFFGYSCEIIRAYKEEIVGPQGGKGFVWRVWAKAIAPTGRFRVAGAACSSTERRFAHLEHDVLAVAETRAKKRAIEELAGMGELELLEEEEENEKTKGASEKHQARKAESIDLGKIPVANKQYAIVDEFFGGDPLKWPEELINKLQENLTKIDKVPIVFVREDGQIDYYYFQEITLNQKEWIEWFRNNTQIKVPDVRRISRERAEKWLFMAFNLARKKGISLPKTEELAVPAPEKIAEEKLPVGEEIS